MAAPAIGINLISSVPTMYSAHYHYDDVSSTLLIIATIISLGKINFKKIIQIALNKRLFQILCVLFFISFLHFLPQSNIRRITKAIPKDFHWNTITEIEKVKKLTQNKRVSVQDVLGVHFNRKKILFYSSSEKIQPTSKNLRL